MNIEKINDLCKRFTIVLDSQTNSLLGNVSEIKNGRIFVSNGGTHRFDFKILWHKPGLAQIQCLSSFKLLTINPAGQVYFEEYFKLSDLSISLFYVVYDNISLCIFPYKNPNLILTYANGLYFKSIDEQLGADEQTIFEYDEIDYAGLQIITTQPNLPYKNIQIVPVANVREALTAIITNYYSLPTNILLCFGKLMFPLDFYLANESWCLVDRRFSIPSLKTYKRRLDLDNLAEFEFLPEEETHWIEISSIVNEIPKLADTQVIWHKLIHTQINQSIYYSSLGCYMLSREQVQRKPANYYNKICSLLEKTKDPRIHKLIEYAMMTIFFSE